MISETNGRVDEGLIRHQISTDISSGDVDRVFEGNVRMRVGATISVKAILSFLDTLRSRHHIRLIELVGTPRDGVTIRVGLRRPLPLISILGQIEEVSRVEVTQGDDDGYDSIVHVQLAEGGHYAPKEDK